MNRLKRKIATRLLAVLMGILVSLPVSVWADAVAPSGYIYDDYDYEAADGTDLTAIPAAMGAEAFKGFSGGYKKNPAGNALDADQFVIGTEPGYGRTIDAFISKPSRLFRTASGDIMNMSPSTGLTQLYYITWDAFLGADAILTGPDPTAVNMGQVIDLSVDSTYNTKFQGGGFIRNASGKTVPFVSWYSFTSQMGSREMQQGKWYTMVMRIETRNGNDGNDKISLKAYPRAETPHPDWDTTIEVNANKNPTMVGLTSRIENTGTQRLGHFRIEKYKSSNTQVLAVKAVEDKVDAAYTAVTNDAADKEEKIAAAQTAISNDLADSIVKTMLQGEINGMNQYKAILAKIATVKNNYTLENYDDAYGEISALPYTLRKADFQKELTELPALLSGTTTVTNLLNNKLPATGTVTLTHRITNNTQGNIMPVVVIAKYDPSGAITDLKIEDTITIGGGLTEQVTESINVDEIQKIKVFTFKDMESIRPLLGAYEITKE